MDSIRERVRQAMEWLKDKRLFNSNRAIAEKMGYNPSVVSQVITGKSNVSERFVKSLCSIYPHLSFEWIWSGNGSMIQETAARQQESDPEPPQFDRFSYILADMAEIIKNMTAFMGPMNNRIERLEKRIDEQAKEIERLRSELSAKEKAATSRKK